MAKQRFATPVIDLPSFPDGPITGAMLAQYTRALVLVLTQQASPAVFRVHEIDLVQALRSGAQDGAYLPKGAVYVDENNTLKMVASDHQWMMPTVISISYGAITTA